MPFLCATRILVSITEEVCKCIYASNPFGIRNCPNNLLSYNSVNVNGSNCAIYVKIVKVCFPSFAHSIVIEFFVFNLIYEKNLSIDISYLHRYKPFLLQLNGNKMGYLSMTYIILDLRPIRITFSRKHVYFYFCNIIITM